MLQPGLERTEVLKKISWIFLFAIPILSRPTGSGSSYAIPQLLASLWAIQQTP